MTAQDYVVWIEDYFGKYTPAQCDAVGQWLARNIKTDTAWKSLQSSLEAYYSYKRPPLVTDLNKLWTPDQGNKAAYIFTALEQGRGMTPREIAVEVYRIQKKGVDRIERVVNIECDFVAIWGRLMAIYSSIVTEDKKDDSELVYTANASCLKVKELILNGLEVPLSAIKTVEKPIAYWDQICQNIMGARK